MTFDILGEVVKVAKLASCQRSSCGAIIVFDNQIIGSGCNSPPGDLESQRRCSVDKAVYHRKISDKTCCVHAEQRAIVDALKNNPGKVVGSILYFVRLGADNVPQESGAPYCTVCSKFALDVGIKGFALYNGSSFDLFDTKEYNTKSYEYRE